MVGLAATYYYDDPGNTKLNTILQRGLQLIGLALVATAPSLPEAGAAAVALLFAAHVGGASSWLPGCAGLFNTLSFTQTQDFFSAKKVSPQISCQ